MTKPWAHGIGFIVSVCALQACAMAPSAFLTQSKLPAHDFIATDSRVRMIAESKLDILSTNGIVVPKRIICTEPSPDVATTLANSFGVGISVLGYGAGSLTGQQVEGLVQLGERTAAIQLLRDKMYQTCIAYANGAISGTTYSLIMSRLDDTIVTLSLGDNAAGAFGRKLAALGGESSANAEASLTGLPKEISKIEDQAAKLSAANKKVDDAEKALQAHKASQPAAGKEEEYKAQTKKLEEDLSAAKGERNALLELVRATARTASEALGKTTAAQGGEGVAGKGDADALREMQGDFLLKDVNRDLITSCLIELGLRDPLSMVKSRSTDNLQAMIDHLATLFTKGPGNPHPDIADLYASAIARGRSTALAQFCADKLSTLITDSSAMFQTYRLRRAELDTEKATARYAGERAKFSAQDRQLFIDSVKLCQSEFKTDEARRNACLDQIAPLKK